MATRQADPYASGRAKRHRQGERDRRRVRTQGGRPRRPPRPPRRRRARRRWPRMRRGGPITMTWGAISLLLGACAMIFQTLAWVIAVGVSLGVTALAHHIESRTTSAGSGTRASKTPPPGGSSGGKGGGGGGGTARRKSAQVINCLESRLQVAPKRVCRKHPRHVVSQDGVTRFNKPLGSPLS